MRKRLKKKQTKRDWQAYMDASMSLMDTSIKLLKARHERRERLKAKLSS